MIQGAKGTVMKVAAGAAGVMGAAVGASNAAVTWMLTGSAGLAGTVGLTGAAVGAVLSVVAVYVTAQTVQRAFNDLLNNPMTSMMTGESPLVNDTDSTPDTSTDGLPTVDDAEAILDSDLPLGIEDGGGCVEAWEAGCEHREDGED